MGSSSEPHNLAGDGDDGKPRPDETPFPSQRSSSNPVVALILEPIQWLQMLSSQLSVSFVVGVVLVYGLNQGFAGSFFRVVSDFYWKDVQRSQPSSVQLYAGLYAIPWVMKPLWGLLTDVFPVAGFRRRPYFVAAGILGAASALAVAVRADMSVASALACLIGLSAAVAIADVVIDACVARHSIEFRSLASDLQSLCGFCSSAGALLGYATSGFFVHHLGPQGALGLLSIPPALLVLLGLGMYEQKTVTPRSEKAVEKVGVAMRGMSKTIKLAHVWKPSLFMYLSLALSLSTHEGQFYWYTDSKAGPGFSQEFVGIIYAIGAMASMVGVLIYHKTLKDYPFRTLLFWAQVFYGVSGMVDLVFVLRWNLALGIPDALFVIAEECVHRVVGRVRWMPMIVLSTRLCPIGIEGTFFALLMCIDSLGGLSAKWGGGILLRAFHVTRTDFTALWLVVLIRNVLRFATLALIFLIPDAGQSDVLVPADLLAADFAPGGTHEDLELAPLNQKARV